MTADYSGTQLAAPATTLVGMKRRVGRSGLVETESRDKARCEGRMI